MNLKQIIREEVRRQLKEFQGEEVLFSINDPKVDDFLQQRFSNYVDYANHKGDDVYVLPIEHYNRFIDQVDSLGYDTDSIQIIREGIKRQLKEISNRIKNYSNSKNKILVGTKSNLLNDMKKRYDFEIDGDETYFFDKGFHFATLYQAGRFYELQHDGTLDDKGYRMKYVVVRKGGSIGGKGKFDGSLGGTIVAMFKTKEEAKKDAANRREGRTSGDKDYYKITYNAVELK